MTPLNLLALNLGSATLKAAAFAVDAHEPGREPDLVERSRVELAAGPDDAHARLAALLAALPERAHAPDLVVHRIVHGGEHAHGCELDDRVMAELEALAPLAPAHQPGALALARAARLRWPQARHAVGFDTAFHSTLAPWSRRLPIPADWAALGLRRFGFHGLAFASALQQVAAITPSVMRARVVLAHLGGGCSVCAVAGGRSVDTTMALTPLSGVPGPTRSGDLDPGLVLHLMRGRRLDAAGIEQRLSHEAGLAGIAGHGDVRALLDDARPEAALALEQFVIRIAQAIAAMATAIGGLDHLVFSGGSGHRAPRLRARIVDRLEWLGLALDAERNASGALLVSPPIAPAVWNVAVDEERELALDVLPVLARRRRAPPPCPVPPEVHP
jgi:acetate kinase